MANRIDFRVIRIISHVSPFVGVAAMVIQFFGAVVVPDTE